jgi:phosphomannomutase / phosphoglucomutase
VRILFPEGWGLVRASNTNPYLTLRFEAKSKPALEAMMAEVYESLRRYPCVTLPS